jgi:hypothetical protein
MSNIYTILVVTLGKDAPVAKFTCGRQRLEDDSQTGGTVTSAHYKFLPLVAGYQGVSIA